MPTKRKPIEDKKILYSSLEISEILEETLAQFDINKVHWLSDEDYAKAIGQFRMNIIAIFDFMKVDDKIPVRYMYGLGNFVQNAVEEIVRLTEDFGLRVRGIDKEISIKIVRRKLLDNIGKSIDLIKEEKYEILNEQEEKEEKENNNHCPECNGMLIFSEGCHHCISCGYSKC